MDIVGATRSERRLLSKLLEGTNIGVVASPKSRGKRRRALHNNNNNNNNINSSIGSGATSSNGNIMRRFGGIGRRNTNRQPAVNLRQPEEPRHVVGCLLGMRSSNIDTNVAFYHHSDQHNHMNTGHDDYLGLLSLRDGHATAEMPELVDKSECTTTVRAFSRSLILEQLAPELRTNPSKKVGHGAYERDEGVYKEIYRRFNHALKPWLGQRLYVAVLDMEAMTTPTMVVVAWDVRFYGPTDYYDFDHYSLVMKQMETHARVYSIEDFEATLRRIMFGGTSYA